MIYTFYTENNPTRREIGKITKKIIHKYANELMIEKIVIPNKEIITNKIIKNKKLTHNEVEVFMEPYTYKMNELEIIGRVLRVNKKKKHYFVNNIVRRALINNYLISRLIESDWDLENIIFVREKVDLLVYYKKQLINLNMDIKIRDNFARIFNYLLEENPVKILDEMNTREVYHKLQRIIKVDEFEYSSIIKTLRDIYCEI